MVIGLTGIIGSGKTEAAKILVKMGYYLIDADLLARDATTKDSPIYPDIVKLFGNKILSPNGEIKRKTIADIIFSDKDLKLKYEAIIHPFIDRLYKKKLAAFPDDTNVVYAAPLLFEVGYRLKDFQHIILIAASKEVCLKRIMLRDKCTEATALARYQAQMPLAEKEKLADIIIYNNSSLYELEKQLLDLADINHRS